MRWIALSAVALLLGCQQAPAPKMGSATSTSEGVQPASEAAQLKVEGDALMNASARPIRSSTGGPTPSRSSAR
jgi:hypothetical protein